ncbi:cold shock domain-containing protein [Paenibacillus sp. FSL W8-0919]|uniref:cold shock domain-containing protein n=1 Tax=Paenibacillus sp. FSL W8-0919 TaxID=2954707 RepID=UPI0030F700CC
MKNGIVWDGLKGEEMAEVHSLIGPSLGKSTVRQIAKNPNTGGEFTGTIAAPIKARGFGFISPDDDDREIFFHVSDSPNADGLKRGTRVRFDLKQNIRSGKTTAVNVSPV